MILRISHRPRPLDWILIALVVVAAPAAAQHGTAGASRPAAAPPREASQFDFLLGQWDLTVLPKVSSLAAAIHGAPRLLGTWKGWRAMDGYGIEDELRIVDGSGNPSALMHSLRAYDSNAHQWIVAGIDPYRGRANSATGDWKNGEMVIVSRGSNADGKPLLSRTRYYDITPAAFKYQQDRSTDDGKTWDEALKITAKRVAATAPR
jgi:hypothetical protein